MTAREISATIALVASAVVTVMLIALVGRAWDWSPFALVMSGAILGLCVGVGLTVMLYATDAPPESWTGVRCGAVNPMLGGRLVCSRPAGHDGDHYGESAPDMWYRWLREP